VLDLAPVLSRQDHGQERSVHRAVVLAYQEMPGQPLRYGALVVRAAPVEVWAKDEMACPLPENQPAFLQFSSSCFLHQGMATPILDTARLFAKALTLAPVPKHDDVDVIAITGPVHAPSPAQLEPESEPEPAPRRENSPPRLTLLTNSGPVTQNTDLASEPQPVGAEVSPERQAVSNHAAGAAPEASAAVAAETQDRDRDAVTTQGSDRKLPASTRRWLVAATLAVAVAVLAAMLLVFPPDFPGDALLPAPPAQPAAGPVKSADPEPALQ
jgi:hypothetical protein